MEDLWYSVSNLGTLPRAGQHYHKCPYTMINKKSFDVVMRITVDHRSRDPRGTSLEAYQLAPPFPTFHKRELQSLS